MSAEVTCTGMTVEPSTGIVTRWVSLPSPYVLPEGYELKIRSDGDNIRIEVNDCWTIEPRCEAIFRVVTEENAMKWIRI